MTTIERLTAVAASLPEEAISALLVLAEQIQRAHPGGAAIVVPRFANEHVNEQTLTQVGAHDWVTQEEFEQELGLRLS